MRPLPEVCHQVIRYLHAHGPTKLEDLADAIQRSSLGTKQALHKLRARGVVDWKIEDRKEGPGRRAFLWYLLMPRQPANEPMFPEIKKSVA